MSEQEQGQIDITSEVLNNKDICIKVCDNGRILLRLFLSSPRCRHQEDRPILWAPELACPLYKKIVTSMSGTIQAEDNQSVAPVSPSFSLSTKQIIQFQVKGTFREQLA